MQAKDDWSFASVTGHDCHNSCIAKIRSCGLPMLVLYGFAMFYVAFYSFTMFSSSPLRCSVRQVNSINKAVVATKTAADTMVLSSTGRLKQQALQEVSKQKGRRSRTGSSFLCSSLTDVQTIQNLTGAVTAVTAEPLPGVVQYSMYSLLRRCCMLH